MGKKIARWALWALIAAHVCVIYALSAQDADLSSQTSGRVARVVAQIFTPDFDSLSPAHQESVVESYQFLTRKAAHVAEYAVLAGLIVLALSHNRRGAVFGAMAASLGCAVLDELHQMYSEGRSAQFTDVLIDGAGALLGILAALLLLRLTRLKEKPPA